MPKFSLPRITMEAISFQRQSMLFFDISAVVQNLRNQPIIDQATLDQSGLNDIVKRRTGLNVKFTINNPQHRVVQSEAAVYTTNAAEIALLSPESPLFKLVGAIAPVEAVAAVVRFQQALKLANTLAGTIDLKNGRVSGVFTQLPCRIWLDAFILHARSPATADEATALILHEIGHVFSCFETILHTTVANVIVTTALEVLKETADQEHRVKFVFEAISGYGGDKDNAEIIANAEDEATQRILLLKTFETYAQDNLAKQLASKETANYRSVEFMADQFATRHGGAIPLASALHKLFKIERRDYGVSAARFYGIEAARYSLMLVGLMTPAWPIAAVVGTICITIGAASVEADDYSPSPLERLGGIKRDLVQLLKDQNLPQSLRKQLLQDVEFVDTLRMEAKSYDSLARFVWKNFFPNGRRQVKLREFQKGLEDLISNDLFIHAQRLKSITDTSPGNTAT